MPGDAVVTGFSGIQPADVPLAPGVDPLDEFFIDLDGTSAQIMSLAVPGAPPEGQLIDAPAKLQVKARDIGQVFAIALDARGTEPTPDIYLGATSAYGLHIVLPDSDDDGAPERVKKGHPNAEWMPGMFAIEVGGSPGAIWRVNGETGEASLFATLPGNSGPGVGDVVYDAANEQFFASDLDNGLIYRIDADGAVIGSFDHGLDGRPARGLPPVPDDGAVADIKNPAFDIEDPGTWGYTPKARMVWGMAVHGGRLYYAVAEGPEVWSVGLSEDGDFLNDARWELAVSGAEHPETVTDMLFDGQGRLVLAQRGSPRGSYDYSVFAEPAKTETLRYRREDPDNPATESVWVEDDPERYAIGIPPGHLHAEGGVALGYRHDETGALDFDACNAMLWSTGHRLRPSADGVDVTDPTEADVHGLQGNLLSLARPENVAPTQSYFTDYDSFFGDAAKAGHVGDVEIWQPCEGVSEPEYGYLPPGYVPPLDTPPDDFPGDWPEGEPEPDYETNLELTKHSNPDVCWEWGGGWLCRYGVQITNTGPDNYFGPLLVDDWLPASPPGALMGFAHSPPWSCWIVGASSYRCFRPNVFLAPGNSVAITAFAWVPMAYDKCHLRNNAKIVWAPGGTPWNTDPLDDFDSASALIPSEDCLPEDEKTDLEIEKRALIDCYEAGVGIRCAYRVTVVNNGPGAYNGDIVVEDEIPAGTTATFSGAGWVCPGAGPLYTCTYAGASLPAPGDDLSFIVRVDMTKEHARSLNCSVRNEVKITQAPGGSPLNTDPTNDTATALATVPEDLCRDEPESNLKLEKTVSDTPCSIEPGSWCQNFEIRVTNTGPDTFNGDITVKDVVPAGLNLSFLAPAGWTCVGDTCQTDAPVTLLSNPPTADEVVLKVKVQGTDALAQDLQCKLTNTALIVSPLGPNQNMIAGDDQDSATADLPASLCKEDSTNLSITKEAQDSICEPVTGGYECIWKITVRNEGPGVHDGPIQLEETLPAEPEDVSFNAPWTCQGVGGGPGAECDHPPVQLQPGEEVVLDLKTVFVGSAFSGYDCSLTNKVAIATPSPGSPGNVNEDDDEAEASARKPYGTCPADGPPACPPGFQWTGERCGRIGITPIPPKPPVRACPQGTTGTYPDCQRIVTPTPECPRGFVGTPPNCRRIQRECPRGTVGKPPNCRRIQRECPRGFVGKPPNCRRIQRECPRGFVGKPPNCRRIQRECPRGFVGKPPNCRRIQRTCPRGTVGTPPNCRKLELRQQRDQRPR